MPKHSRSKCLVLARGAAYHGPVEIFESLPQKIDARSCDLNVVFQCNLSCRGCYHLSPVMKNMFADPKQVFDDFEKLSKHYHTQSVALVGGEPLLHPNLAEIIGAVRASQVCETIRLVTNGLLLDRMKRLTWQSLDEVEISCYPDSSPSEQLIARNRDIAADYEVKFQVIRKEYFRIPYSETGTANTGLIHRIYRACRLAHLGYCHTVHQGYFYKCAPSLFLPLLHAGPPSNDGIKIDDSKDFRQKLKRYLDSQGPLGACRHCLGSAGKRIAHHQVHRNQWRQHQKETTESLLDYDSLNVTELVMEAAEKPNFFKLRERLAQSRRWNGSMIGVERALPPGQ